MVKTLARWRLGHLSSERSLRPQVSAPLKCRDISAAFWYYIAEGLLSICMIIIWLTNVKQELVKVSHLQKVSEDQLRLIQSNYSSTAKCPTSTTDEGKIITRWSGSDMPRGPGLFSHIYYCNSYMAFATKANISRFGSYILCWFE